MSGMMRNLKQKLEIAEKAADPRIKLEARQIAKYLLHVYYGPSNIWHCRNRCNQIVAQKQEQLDTLRKLDGG
jgi:hypothetical protein